MSDLATLEHQGTKTLMDVLKKYERSFKNVLPKHLTADRWAWLAINSIRQTPKLVEVTPASFINSVLLASNMGLEIRSRSSYLVPFGKECQLLIDYRGKMELARRAGVGAISLELVRDGDEFDVYEDERGPHMIHRWVGRERGEICYGYMSAQVNGSRQIEVMSLKDIESIRRRSRSGAGRPIKKFNKEFPSLTLSDIRKIDPETLASSDPYRVPWVTDYDQMARKTVMHRGSNYLPQTPELMTSQDVDNAVLGDKPMPQAPELTEFLDQLDPADNKPLIDIPETAEERTEAQRVIAEEKVGKPIPPKTLMDHEGWPDDPESPKFGVWIKVDGLIYCRAQADGPWRKYEA